MGDSRSKNSVRNISTGLLNRGITIILPFINRTIIIYSLGVEFAGLGSLFTSILAVLSIAEMGFHTAIVYSMYEPIANGNDEQICELLTLYRKVYRIVGGVVLGLGLVILPFIKSLIQGEVPNSVNIYIIFLMYLVNSALSYFLYSYKESILIATQRIDMSYFIRTSVLTAQYIIQAIVLLVSHNYYLYLTITIISTIATNISIGYVTKIKFPMYKALQKKVRMPNEIKKQVSGLLINNISDKARNSFDSIIASMIGGLALVGIYNNYFYIFNALYQIVLVIITSTAASIGNSIATESVQKNYRDLRKFNFIQCWLIGLISVCMVCIYQPFMKIWVGDNLLLKDYQMVLFCVYFFAISLNNVRNQYLSGKGLWWQLKYSYIFEALGNLILNFLLGKLFGVTGILLASIITIVVFNYVMRSQVLFRSYFTGISIKPYFMDCFFWAAATIISGAVCFYICSFIMIDNGFLTLALRFAAVVIVCNVIFFFAFCRTSVYRDARTLLQSILKPILHRLGVLR